jgi:hypothetical protein
MTQSKARSKLWNKINGSTGVQVVTSGGTFGSQSTAFTANPTEGDSITINGTTFTFYDNGNTPGTDATVEIEMAGTPALATSLEAAETLIEAHPSVGTGSGVLSNVDVTDTDTDLSFTWMPGVTGVMVTSTDGANTTDGAYSAGTAATAINPAKAAIYSEWADAGSTLTYLTLADGTVDGQAFEFYCASETTAGDTIGILGSFLAGDNLATVTGAAGDGATFYWDQTNGLWKMTKATNVALSHTNEVAL